MSAWNHPPIRSALLLLSFAVLCSGGAVLALGQAAFPSRLETYFTNVVKLSAAERKLLLAGSSVSRVLEADPAKEVAVFGAIWIDAPSRSTWPRCRTSRTLKRARAFG